MLLRGFRESGPACCAVTAAIAIAACGGGSGGGNGVAAKSPNQIIAAVSRAVPAIKSVHVAGALKSGGERIRLDLDLVAGKGGKGSMSENGLGFQLIALGDKVYISGGPAFWTHFGGAAAAQLFKGKWLEGPTSGQFASLVSLLRIDTLFDKLLSSHGKLSKGASTKLHGQPVIGVTDTTNGGTLYVASTGKPYPIELVKIGSGGGRLDFTRFDQPVTITAPRGAINVSAFH